MRCRILVVTGALLTACGPREVRVTTITEPLPDGRFAGPIAVTIPPRSAHGNDEYLLHVTLVTRCDPELHVRFPDGEEAVLDRASTESDHEWQELQEARAQAEAPSSQAASQPAASQPASVEATTAAAPLPPVPGHYLVTEEESWQGQLDFQFERAERCADSESYTLRHRLAYEDGHTLTLWADVPQEIAGASLRVDVGDLIGTAPPPATPQVASAAPAPAADAQEVAAATPAPPKPPAKPTTPEPPPKPEHPDASKAASGARWHPGYWAYDDDGHWVWQAGWWDAPLTTPPLRAEISGRPPLDGCHWHEGHWEWIDDGHWEWHAGDWDPPPPRVETPGDPPGTGSQWQAGSWFSNGQHSFYWLPGSWTEPVPLVETPPPPPHPNAHWVPGTWVQVGTTWTWTPGFYLSDGVPPPPAPRQETPPPSPAPGSVWLAGYWEWDDGAHAYRWTSGHWERPPSRDYTWVADPPPPGYTIVPRGHWVLKIDVRLTPPGRQP